MLNIQTQHKFKYARQQILFLNFVSMLNSFTQYRSWGTGFGAIDYIFSSVVGQRKGPIEANAPPVHGIKKCLVLQSVQWLFSCTHESVRKALDDHATETPYIPDMESRMQAAKFVETI